MATQLRDTQFGRLLRFLSANRLFPYPDERDHSIRMRFYDQGGIERFGQVKTKFPSSDKTINSSNSLDTTPQVAGAQEEILEAPPNTYLVDWYGQDDPEV